MKEFDKLPINIVMRLYRQKLAAEEKDDKDVLLSLEKLYPDLFSVEFEEFISNLQKTIEYIEHKYGENFQEILEPVKVSYH